MGPTCATLHAALQFLLDGNVTGGLSWSCVLVLLFWLSLPQYRGTLLFPELEAAGVDVGEVMPVAYRWGYLGLRSPVALCGRFRVWRPEVDQLAAAA
eukprot:15431007-Alexandrium_andersonii.AAC.1